MTCDIDLGGSDVDDVEGDTPTVFALYPVRPNPSSGIATVSFALPEAAGVNLSIYDIKGRKVATLADEELNAGFHSRDISGLSSGVYLYELIAGEFNDMKKMVVK